MRPSVIFGLFQPLSAIFGYVRSLTVASGSISNYYRLLVSFGHSVMYSYFRLILVAFKHTFGHSSHLRLFSATFDRFRFYLRPFDHFRSSSISLGHFRLFMVTFSQFRTILNFSAIFGSFTVSFGYFRFLPDSFGYQRLYLVIFDHSIIYSYFQPILVKLNNFRLLSITF